MPSGSRPARRSPEQATRIAVTGASGQLGGELVSTLRGRGHRVAALARPEFDITRRADLEALTGWRPDIVVNAAAWTDVDACALDPERALAINGRAAGEVAAAAAAADALVVQLSTNEVFDGRATRPYREDDTPNPVNPYGSSKLAGERAVSAATGRHLIVRTAWLFGRGPRNFVNKITAAALRARDAGQALRVVDDEVGNPTPTDWLAEAIARLGDGVWRGELEPGVWHLAGTPPASRYDWARHILDGLKVKIEPMKLADYERPSRPPPHAPLDTARSLAARIPAGAWTDSPWSSWRSSADPGAGAAR